jgi:hypothetical protein
LIVSAGAVLGGTFTVAQLCATAGIDADANESVFALEEALRAHLLREAPMSDARGAERYMLAHEQLRDVAYTEAGAPRRRLLHRRALAALETSTPAADLVRHALGADQPAVAFALSARAGDEASRLFATRDAIRRYSSALEIAQDAALPRESADASAVLQKLGRAHELNNDAAAAQLAYEAWVHNAEASGDARSRSLALNRLATAVAQDRLNIPRALALLEQAAAAAQLARSDSALAETEWNRALLNIYRGDAATALAHAQAVLPIAERSGDDELIGRILNIMGTANNALGRPAHARDLLNTALRIFERRDDHALQADCLSLRANALLLLCDVDGALASARGALALAERDGNLWGQAQSTTHLIVAELDAGNVEAALAAAERINALAGSVRFPLMSFFHLIALGNVYRAAGRASEAPAAAPPRAGLQRGELGGCIRRHVARRTVRRLCGAGRLV